MRTVDASFSTAIGQGTLKVAELFLLELSDGSVYRYTSHPKDISWDAAPNTYKAVVIGRSPIQFTNSFESDSVQVVIGNITGDIYSEVQANILEACKITIKRILWDDSYAADREIIIFVGYADVEFDRSILTLQCRPLEDSLNVKIPRHTFQEPCNHTLFDVNCTVVRASHKYSGTATGGTTATLVDTDRGLLYKVAFDGGSGTIAVGDVLTGGTGGGSGVVAERTYQTSGSGILWYVEQTGVQFVNDEVLSSGGDTMVVNGTPAVDTELYLQGELEMSGGNNDGQRRPVLSDESNVLTIMWPFANVVESGDTYNIYPGCNKKAETCDVVFNNDENFRGFLYVPKIEESMM